MLVTWAAITWLQSCTLLTWHEHWKTQLLTMEESRLVHWTIHIWSQLLVKNHLNFWSFLSFDKTHEFHIFFLKCVICWILARKFKCVKWYLFLGWDSNLVNFSATFNLESFKLIRQATKIPNNYSIMSIFYFSFEMVFVLCKPEAAFLMVVQL